MQDYFSWSLCEWGASASSRVRSPSGTVHGPRRPAHPCECWRHFTPPLKVCTYNPQSRVVSSSGDVAQFMNQRYESLTYHRAINWLQVLDATELAQIDQRIRHQFHAIMALW